MFIGQSDDHAITNTLASIMLALTPFSQGRMPCIVVRLMLGQRIFRSGTDLTDDDMHGIPSLMALSAGAQDTFRRHFHAVL